ncbi:amino acid permease [Acrocarpospora macrocephala]|uniref:Amino acid permease n=1 Tax=Acrocarpospora macrocephala TaxID=150177 RepID=A0A5M3WVB9_9ACTN|nr:APC family permease [Acrocarpospora macrocephala]GES11251.1 amino acid permease [Acrocarpospora macrocephala]
MIPKSDDRGIQDGLTDDEELRSFGYEPQLDRTMGLMSSLSISISCMCITAGIFTTYAYSLGMIGPVFVWTFLVVAVGQVLVALVLAELAGRMPISGYAFQWTSRLINSHYGWFVGWAGLMAFIPGFTGLNFGLAPILQERLGLTITPTSTLVVVIVVTLTQLIINLIGVKLAAKINNAAAFVAELGLSIVLTIILLVVGFVTNPVQDLGFLTTSSVDGPGFTGALLMSSLLAIWVLTGFEGAADLAEETKMAKKQVPRAVVTALVVSLTIGFFMLVALTMNIGNLAETTSAEVPITHILRGALGTAGSAVFEIVAMIALYAGGLANMAAASRLMFSMSRDRMLPGSARLSQVSRRRSPAWALSVIALMSVALITVGTYLAKETVGLIVGMASVGYYAVYALTIGAVLYASATKRLSKASSFSLGIWATPVRWVAFLWSLFVVGELVIPEANRQTALMAGIFFLIAAVWYVTVLRARLTRGQAGIPRADAPH